MSAERRINLGGLSEVTPELRLAETLIAGLASLVQNVRDGNIYLPSPRKKQVKN